MRVDAVLVNLLRWLGKTTLMSGCRRDTPMDMPCIKIREIAFGGGKKLSRKMALQFMMERLFASSAPSEEAWMRSRRKTAMI